MRALPLLPLIAYLAPSTAARVSSFEDTLLVLNTGQRRCYAVDGRPIACRGSGQDGELRPGLAWPADRFRPSGGCVVDLLTELEWSRCANPAEWPMPHDEAVEYVAKLNRARHLGRDDWRLPGRAELRSLTGFQTRNPALPAGHPFTDVYLSWYWTATASARNPEYAWYVHMEGARTFFGHRSEDHLVWPCRGYSRVVPVHGSIGVDSGRRFEARRRTVLDRATGLEWTRDADLARGQVSWEEALSLVRGLDLRGSSPGAGWRVPTINELDSLVDLGSYEPALPAKHPFERVADAYWSSTTSAYEPDWAMALYFDLGRVGVGQKNGRWLSVWAVRSTSPPRSR